MQTLMYVQPAFGVFLPFLFCHVKIFFHRQFDGLHLYFVLTSVADDFLPSGCLSELSVFRADINLHSIFPP